MTVTDLPDVLESLVNNVEHNRSVWESCEGSARARPLKWGSSKIDEFSSPDILIGSDCVYYNEVSLLNIYALDAKSANTLSSLKNLTGHILQKFQPLLLTFFTCTIIYLYSGQIYGDR